MRPLAISGGDCAGIGPEITAMAVAQFPEENFIVYTDPELFTRACACAGVEPPRNLIFHEIPFAGEAEAVVPGQNAAAVGELAYQSVVAAGKDALAGKVRGLVTAPFSKAALHLAGHHDIPGHTELLAHLCGRDEATMAFFSPKLVLSLATIHCALAEVPALLTRERLERVLRDTATMVAKLKGRRPRIGVLALNPHAGEAGAFGDEEARVIVPTMEALHDVADFVGPLVPDTALVPKEGQPPFDGFVAMYHDQGLIPFKLLAFDEGVNVTLGLPIVRTSPDHGTAFDLAWKGVASPASMICAIQCAKELTA